MFEQEISGCDIFEKQDSGFQQEQLHPCSTYLDVQDYETKNKMHVVITTWIQIRENGSLDFDSLVNQVSQ